MATTLNTPDVLTQPIANNGDKNSIPSTNDPTTGLMSQSLGFPPVCSERIADGGKAPSRADMNGALNLTSQHHFFLQNGGTETFRQAVSDAIGGYPMDARLWYTDSLGNSRIVKSTRTNNTYNFNSDSSYVGAKGSGKPWEIEAFVDTANTDHLTDCILQIPQDLNFELSSGTLTLKNGSKFYLPDGTEKAVSADKTKTITTDGIYIIYSNGTNGNLNHNLLSNVGSGATLPADNTNYSLFFNTTDLKIYHWSSGAWAEYNVSFPEAIVVVDGGQITSIEQVFNGFGFFGNCVFLLPDVKVLIPQGRNEDGTLKNFVRISSGIHITGNNDTNRTKVYFYTTGNINRVASASYIYDQYTNHYIRQSDGAFQSVCYIATLETSTNHIDGMNPKPVFHATDYWSAAKVNTDNVFENSNTFNGSVAFNGSFSAGATARATMVSWGIPETSRAVSLNPATDFPYTTTEDCYIAFKHTGNSASSGVGNGIVVDSVYGCASTNGVLGSSDKPVMYGGLYVAAGSTVTLASSAGTYEVWMIPLKGIE